MARTNPDRGARLGRVADLSATLPAGLFGSAGPSVSHGWPAVSGGPYSLPAVSRGQQALRFSDGNGKRRPGTRRRLLALGYLASLVAVAVVVSGGTYGLFSTTFSSSSSTFGAGTVSLTGDRSGACTVSSLLPDGSTRSCTLKATYAGNAPGYMALDVLIETQAGSGGSRLFNPADGANDLQVVITSTSPSATFTVPASPTTCPGSAPGGSDCYELDNEIVAKIAFTAASPQVTFTTTLSLPTTSGSGYQGGAAQVILTAHAVQSSNNPGVGSCTVGQPCGSVTWS